MSNAKKTVKAAEPYVYVATRLGGRDVVLTTRKGTTVGAKPFPTAEAAIAYAEAKAGGFGHPAELAAPGATPAELAAGQVEELILSDYCNAKAGYEKCRDKFAEAVLENPIQAIDWQAEPMAEAQGYYETWCRLGNQLEGETAKERVCQVIKAARAELLRIATDCPWDSQSTSPARNMVEAKRLTGKVKALRTITMYADAVESN